MNKRKIVNDPVFGFITIPCDLIYDLMQHPIVHRLSRIKQLGLTCYVYPGAQHTRFQHSLGALFLMTEAIKTLQNKGNEITPEEAEAVYAAIFLHDVGHGPFSHTLEEFFYKDISHEDIGIAIIEKLNEELEGRLSLTINILRNTYHKKFLHELVSGQLDMDRLDYLRRDSFFTGVTEGNIGSARIIKMLNIKDGKLVVEAKGIYSIENFLMSRRLMYWQVYLHKTAFAAELMLCKTLERARFLVQKGENVFAPENLMYFLKNQPDNINCTNLSQFTTLDDTDIWVAMKIWSTHSDKVLATLSSGIINRNIFKLEISNSPILTENQNRKIQEIQEKLDLNREDAEFLVAHKVVSNNLYSKGETGIDIIYSNGETKNISQASDMFNLDLLSKKVSKYYFCYVKGL